MTREQALDELSVLSERMDDTEDYTYTSDISVEAIDIAIEALSAEPCEDAISRQAVLYGLASIAKAKAKSDAQKALIGRVMFFIEQLPPVTPKQKMGRWLAVEDEDMNTVGYYCSECDLPLETEERTPFCPNCGAKMESGDQK